MIPVFRKDYPDFPGYNRRMIMLLMNPQSPDIHRSTVDPVDIETHDASDIAGIGKLPQHGLLAFGQIERNRTPLVGGRENQIAHRTAGHDFQE